MTGITTYSYDLYHRNCMNKPIPINHDALLDEIHNKDGDIIGFRCDACKKEWIIISKN